MNAHPAEPASGPGPQEEVIAFLGDPRTHGGQSVERIDTHAALVFLAGDRALKLKRAVRYPYLDYSTVGKRRAACLAELAINRRTAPALYRGVVAIRRGADGGLRLDEEDGDAAGDVPVDAIDWLVSMARFPDEALFDRMAERDGLTPALMRRLAERIAAFHRDAAPRPDGGGVEALRVVADGNLEDLRAAPDLFPADAVARLAERTGQALDRLAPLLETRRRDGFVRHGHGDLHLRNIVLLDGEPTLFDAIEFDEALAVADVFYDLAFLLMDLDHRGLRPLGNAVLNRYLEETADYGGLAALPLFLSLRAAVRAKVSAAALRLGGKAEGLAGEARRYLDQALAALEPAPARLVAVGGLSGTGKTRLATGIAPDLGSSPGAVVLRSDVLRKRLCGVADTDRLPADGYAAAVTERVYAELYRRAASVLGTGQAVVVDAVSARPDERRRIEAVAAEAGVRFDGIWMEAPLSERVVRVTNRRNDASDATADVVERQESYDLGTIDWTRLDSGRVAADVLDDARASLA
ncbi:bifunctional aminoglycoside phosphotransferase/ATP-binding protein [Azospirillum sp. Sh1]|uniref:bifunctional aminoglycoside phosphotransferase/ATP-binding protein n=1 Tax=Azospirillum sp. Sh1 TaxID=2607285 RepID=UPI0011ED87BF|nr:bifunctional aminoglycoside phosphotransferase/ATP-binding protein [Azospirillum sp. Sh1]KAA0572588.1 AAA family ATPase [Azospirillum sp. Sh1]